MVEARLLDSAGRRRSPASMPGYHLGRIPRNKGQRYPADPPRTEEIVAVMRHAGENLHGDRVRALIVILWRAGLCIQEALSLTELDLDPRRGSVLVRCGKGGRRREIGMDVWGFEHIQPWLEARVRRPRVTIVMGLDQHRAQITADWLDTETGEVTRADRARRPRECPTVRRPLPRPGARGRAGSDDRLAVRRRRAPGGRGAGASRRAGRDRGAARDQEACQERPGRRPAPARVADGRPVAGVVDPARAPARPPRPRPAAAHARRRAPRMATTGCRPCSITTASQRAAG